VPVSWETELVAETAQPALAREVAVEEVEEVEEVRKEVEEVEAEGFEAMASRSRGLC
jgi:hypothetical protein